MPSNRDVVKPGALLQKERFVLKTMAMLFMMVVRPLRLLVTYYIDNVDISKVSSYFKTSSYI